MVQAMAVQDDGDSAYMGMHSDISQSIEKRMDHLALVPSTGTMARSFVSRAYSEARRRRKKPIFLASSSDINWIQSALVEARGGDKGREGIASVGKGVMSCLDNDERIDPGDMINHCFRKGTINSCPFQSGFDLNVYREIRKSGGALLDDMGDELKESGMCPARTALDLVVEAEAVVAHYSFLFTEDWKGVMELLERDGSGCLLIVHDPSSLVEFLEKRFTYSFSIEDLSKENWILENLEEEEQEGLILLLELLQNLATKTDPKKQVERRLLIENYRSRAMEKHLPQLTSITSALKRTLENGGPTSITVRRNIKDLYMFVKLWMGQYTGVSRARREDEDNDRLEVSLVDLSVIAQPVLQSFSSVIMLGDTLYPHSIYAYTLGMRSERIMNRTYIDRTTMKGTHVLSLGNVDISYKHRSEASYERITESLSRICETTPGLKIAVFPSYYIQGQVMSAMAENSFPYPVVEEVRGMTRDAKAQVLNEVKTGGELLALTVQGGSIVRAVEDGSLSPETVIMVGLHIPPPSPASNQKKLHLQKKYTPNIGHIITVLMPAMTSVMRMVNTLMSTDLDRRNMVVLLDRRFQDRRVLECLPRFYDVKLLSAPKEFDGSRILNGEGIS